MKLRHFILSAFVIGSFSIFYSCGDKNITSPHVNSKVLPGVWEIRDLFGPLIDVDPNYLLPGNGNTWSFSDSFFVKRNKDSVYKSGTYTISNNSGINPLNNKSVNQFIFDSIPAESFVLQHDTLFIFDHVTDQFQSTAVYIKIADNISKNTGH